ncbi:serine threonine- kinase endoribonuclease ire1 [Pyrenophora seminiperda CCB06]|uniref:non-specific serine/threonine protein kinase n=1 Tax=Pyrenophora seminiperda CCB06 TaxID=1302712 RepID=A0A3M7MHC3_9PLEO|nr:serine threonine- kinase endoribonuclease ire1 [Pyrenophora seminiperda CCB06]
MPRPRRPPGAGSALTTLAATLILLAGLVVAQQQQPLEHDVHKTSPHTQVHVGHARIIHPPVHHPQRPSQKDTLGDAAEQRRPYTPLLSQNVRAVATKVPSAPAISAVRAHPARYAASGGLVPGARSLRDWEVEDFFLLATVDGHIHARDRTSGEEIWELTGRPMLETIYNVSEGSTGPPPFVWIVEPREDGALYLLSPGPRPHLQHLGVTVKQLAESAPYSSDYPGLPVVYNVEKKTFMLLVDAASGNVKQSFSPSGTFSNDESCAPESKNFFARERDCRGVIDIGQTQYTITIHNKKTNEHICTIKYAEWNPNSRDRDLQSQYDQTLDKQYIYTVYDGKFKAFDYKRPGLLHAPLYTKQLPSPVARVFDVARPLNDQSSEPPLVLLPQPAAPVLSEDNTSHVLLNQTESGAWYALSEINYPNVTSGAPDAPCYKQSEVVYDWDASYMWPDKRSLIGVHRLDYRLPTQHTELPGIPAPTYYETVNEQVSSNPPETSPREQHQAPTIDAPPQAHVEAGWNKSYFYIVVMICLLGAGATAKPTLVESALSYSKKLMHLGKKKQPLSPFHSSTPPEGESAEDKVLGLPDAEDVIIEKEAVESPDEAEVKVPISEEAKEKKTVTFDIPADEEEDLTPLSRTTTVDLESAVADEAAAPEVLPNGDTQSMANSAEDISQDSAAPATPKKKKTHRGRRGGRKLSKNQQKEEDEVNRIVNAAKQLEVRPRLQPDELTVSGGDVQNVSEIKRIGKLTIDQDRLLGNGSGGTFVFEGKWKEVKVAVKRMLPQYFGLAEQEVKLLQNSDPHPNVIRYFDDERDENFLYIAVELCQASLFDLYKDGRPGEERTEPHQQLVNKISGKAAPCLYQLAAGLNHLHHLRIIHRDIKPQNILIAQPLITSKDDVRLVISDFGLCKTLPDNVSTLVGTTGNAGTIGWKAPELISQPKELTNNNSQGFSRDSSSSTDPVAQGVKRAVDIFSLGCVFYYVLTGGCHPFDDEEGWMQIREYNIKKEKSNLDRLLLGADSVEPHHLIQWMLRPRPEDRPTALQVMNHPFFWDDQKRLDFLCDCSDHWEREPRDPPSHHLAQLEDYSQDVLDHKRNFLAKLDQGFINSLGKQRKYTGDKMLDLLRALRNKKNHYEDMDDAIKAKVGPLPGGYLRYWTVKFPQLLMSCYEAVLACDLELEPRFRKYFESMK